MLAVTSLAFSAVSTLLASRCILAAPLPANTPPHEQSTGHSHGSPRHGSPIKWHDSGIPTHEKLLITSTDAKYDDKMGMTANERINKYKHHDIHYNGLVDVEGAHAHTADWFKHMDEAGKDKFHKSHRNYYKGGTPFKDRNGKEVPAAGEHLFREDKKIDFNNVPPLKKLKTGDDAHIDLVHHAGKHADFISMAPIPEAELKHKLKAYKDADVHIDNFVHVEGYNSRQDMESRKSPSKGTANFVQNMQDMVQEHHPNANVIFTHSRHNFGDGQGATQPYKDLVNRTPFHHVQTVGSKDPFAMNQIDTAEKYIREDPDKPEFHPFLGADDKNRITPPELWQARRSKDPSDPKTVKLQHNTVKAIDANTPLLEDNHIKYRLGQVKSGILDGCQGETCDANHIVLAHHAIKKGADGFDKVHIDNDIRLHKAEPHQKSHGLSPKMHPNNKAMVTKTLMDHFPIVNHDAFREKEEQ